MSIGAMRTTPEPRWYKSPDDAVLINLDYVAAVLHDKDATGLWRIRARLAGDAAAVTLVTIYASADEEDTKRALVHITALVDATG